MTPRQSGDISIRLPARACTADERGLRGRESARERGRARRCGGCRSRHRSLACRPSTTGRRRSTSAFT